MIPSRGLYVVVRRKRVLLARARKAAGFIQEEAAHRLKVDRSTIARWESGETEPLPWLRPKLAKLLGITLARLEELLLAVEEVETAPSPAEGGERRDVDEQRQLAVALPGDSEDVKLEEVDEAKRQKFVHTTTLGGVSLLLAEPRAALLAGITSRPAPRRVAASDIAQIRDATQTCTSWSRAYGGGTALEAALGELHWAAGLLEAICPDRLRPELDAAVGYLADVVAFLAVDAGAHEEARLIYGFALACAERAKDWNLRAEILSSMAKQAIWTGQPDEGLTLAEFALVRADLLTPTGRSLLHTDRARALATMRRVQESLWAIGTADEHFAHVTPENEPPWWGYYSAARHDQLTGQPLVELAILGRDPGEATTRLTAAVAGQPDYPGCRAICLSKLASLTMATGDPRHAVTIGTEALEVAGTLRSHRTTEELRELFRHAATHQDLEEVADLRHRIRTLVCTDNPDNPPLDDPPGTPE